MRVSGCRKRIPRRSSHWVPDEMAGTQERVPPQNQKQVSSRKSTSSTPEAGAAAGFFNHLFPPKRRRNDRPCGMHGVDFISYALLCRSPAARDSILDTRCLPRFLFGASLHCAAQHQSPCLNVPCLCCAGFMIEKRAGAEQESADIIACRPDHHAKAWVLRPGKKWPNVFTIRHPSNVEGYKCILRPYFLQPDALRNRLARKFAA